MQGGRKAEPGRRKFHRATSASTFSDDFADLDFSKIRRSSHVAIRTHTTMLTKKRGQSPTNTALVASTRPSDATMPRIESKNISPVVGSPMSGSGTSSLIGFQKPGGRQCA